MPFDRATSPRAALAHPDPGRHVDELRSLYEREPRDGAVVCFGDLGPIRLSPLPPGGSASHRRDGIRYLFAAYDVHSDRLAVTMTPGHTSADVLRFLRRTRRRYPRELCIRWVQSNL